MIKTPTSTRDVIMKKKVENNFFSPPGSARELKSRPFESESKTTALLTGCHAFALYITSIQIYHKLKEKYVGRGGQCPTTDAYGFSDCIKWKNYGGKVYFLQWFLISFQDR